MKEAKEKQANAEQELEASQFQSGSIAGKKLMQKCKELQACDSSSMCVSVLLRCGTILRGALLRSVKAL